LDRIEVSIPITHEADAETMASVVREIAA